MFHRAILTDPGLWAAKFNYAELPFNRGNYTDARTRFEELFSQTDATKQPREAELTQYKVFLTLLLEGKVEAASTFMDHLNFSGATPARYFCNAALNFRAGSVDKAKNWIDDAKKEFPAATGGDFHRIILPAWMDGRPQRPARDGGGPGHPGRDARRGDERHTAPPRLPRPRASPSATPMGTAAASTPIIVAAASATPTPFAPATATPARAVALASASPIPAASVPPVIAATTPAAAPGPQRPGGGHDAAPCRIGFAHRRSGGSHR